MRYFYSFNYFASKYFDVLYIRFSHSAACSTETRRQYTWQQYVDNKFAYRADCGFTKFPECEMCAQQKVDEHLFGHRV